jgi:ABC-2 type transport system permease protein
MSYIITLGVFSILQIVALFKAPVDDGTELLIMSKSLSRNDIFFSRIIVSLQNIFFICITTTLFFLLVNVNTKSSYFPQDIFGLFIGSLVSMILFSGLTLLFSIKLSRITTVIVTFLLLVSINLFQVFIPFINTYPNRDTLKERDGAIITVNNLVDYKNQKINLVNLKSDKMNNIEYFNSIEKNNKQKIISVFNAGEQLTRLFNLNIVTESSKQKF